MMEEIIPVRIQIASILGSVAFLLFIARLILKGKLRAEYSIIWLVCTLLLLMFSFWREGLHVVARTLGVAYPPSLIFLAATFAIIIFLVHLSTVISRLQNQIKEIAQEVALGKGTGLEKL
jgi:hypothetical protein